MNSSRLALIAIILLTVLTGCDQDTDTPAPLKREDYYNARLKAADQEIVTCENGQYILPKTDGRETLGLYILAIHAANRGGPLATMKIAEMQTLYRSCLRPAILNRVRAVSRRDGNSVNGP